MGGMRQLCISACEQEGIAVRLESPDLSRARYWREAFLTGEKRTRHLCHRPLGISVQTGPAEKHMSYPLIIYFEPQRIRVS